MSTYAQLHAREQPGWLDPQLSFLYPYWLVSQVSVRDQLYAPGNHPLSASMFHYCHSLYHITQYQELLTLTAFYCVVLFKYACPAFAA